MPDPITSGWIDENAPAAPLTPQQQLAAQVAKEEDAKGLTGSIEQGVESAGNQLLFGLPEDYLDNTQTPEEIAHRQAVEEYHQGARYLGGAVGLAGSLLAGGELFKGVQAAGDLVAHGILPAAELADASLASRVASKAVSGAVQGAILNTPKALIEGTWGGDWNKAGETLLWGMGPGAVIGSGHELLSAATQGIGSGLTGLLDSSLVKNAEGPTLPGQEGSLLSPTGQLGQSAALDVFGAGQAGANRSQLADLAQQVIDNPRGHTQQAIAETLRNAAVDRASQLNDVLSTLDGHITKGTTEQDLVSKAIKPGELGDAIKQATDSPELEMPMNADQKAARDMMIASSNMIPTTKINGREVVTMADANKFIGQMREKWLDAITDGNPEAADKLKGLVYQSGNNFLLNKADQVATAVNNPELTGTLTRAKQDLSNVSDLQKFLTIKQQEAAQQQLQGIGSLISSGARGPFSRLGGMAGGVAGGLVSHAVGGGLPGYFIGREGGKVAGGVLDFMAKRWLKDSGLALGSKVLNKAAQQGSGVFASVLSSDAQQRLQDTLSTIGRTIKAMEARSTTLAQPTYNTMSQLLGSGAKGLSAEQQQNKLAKRLNDLAANPNAALTLTSHLSSPFAEAGSPLLAQAYQNKMLQAMGYLHSALPQGSAHQVQSEPFGPKYSNTVSPSDAIAFRDKAEIVANPLSALNHLQQGTLSTDHLEALSTVYPALFTMMKQELLQVHNDHPDLILRDAQRDKVKMFLGYQNPDDNIAVTQSRFTPQAPKGGAGHSSGGKTKKAQFKSLESSNATMFSPQGVKDE